MEDEDNQTTLLKTINNGQPQEDVGETNVDAVDLSPPEEDLHHAPVEDATKQEDVEIEAEEEKSSEELRFGDQDVSLLNAVDEKKNKDNDEDSGGSSSTGNVSLPLNELNGELETVENSTNENLQNEVVPTESQENEEESRCDVVRRSIRNRKSIDSRKSGFVKQAKPSKESAIKKPKKTLPMIGSHSDQTKRIYSHIESTRVGGLGALRARKKQQRKREKNSVANLRGLIGSIRADPSSRPSIMAAPLTCAEYAQYLGLQPAVKFKCHKCGETNFASIGMLTEHQADCPGVLSVTSDEPAACATLAASGSNLHITQKLILCSACDTYFESWDLFLHMQSVHRRHICLFCLAMFSRAERLACHLGSAHGASEASHPSADAFRSSRQSPCLLVCCTCERIFSDGDEFFDHSCRSGGLAGSLVDSVASSPSGGSGERKRETSGGNIGDSTSRTELSSETTRSDGIGNNQHGTSDSDAECIVNNAANLCQLHIRFAAKKDLKRNDNVLVVIFDKDDRSNEMLMRVESKESWGENVEDSNQLTDEVADKSSSDEPASQEEEVKQLPQEPDNNGKLDINEDSAQKSMVSEPSEVNVPTEENERNDDDLENEPRIDKDDLSSEEIDKSDSENMDVKSPESVHEENVKSESTSEANLPAAEVVGSNPVNDQCHSEMSADSLDEINEKSLETDNDAEVPDDDGLSKTKAFPIKFDSDSSQSCQENNNELNGNDILNDYFTRFKQEVPLAQETVKSEESNVSKPLPSVSPEETYNQEIGNTNNVNVTQQNGVDLSTDLVNTSSAFSDPLDESGGIQLAGLEVPLTPLYLEKDLKDYTIQDLLKEAVKATCFSCVYCTHAKKIAVNGKQLAFHLLAEHRFHPIFDATETNDRYSNDDSDIRNILGGSNSVPEEHLDKKEAMPEGLLDQNAITEFVEILKNSIEDLETSCFNCDSYDNANAAASKVFSKTYECFQCRFATGLHKELYIHNRKMHQKTNLLCIMCKCTFYSYSELLCHLCPGVYVPNERPKFRCCFCSADSLPSAFRFMVHLRKRHHACDVCLEVTGDQQRLSGHVWKHKLNHLCYRCDIAYRNKPDITKHLFWKHGTESVLCKRCLQKKWPHVYHFCVPPAIFTCEECGSTFSRAMSLRVHRRLHLGEAPHACPECGQHFISKKLVTKHQELKHGEPINKPVSESYSDAENIAVDSRAPPDGGSSGHMGLNDVENEKDLRDSVSNTNLSEKSSEKKEKSLGNVTDSNHSCGNNEMSQRIQELKSVPTDVEAKDLRVESGESTSNRVNNEVKPAKKVVDVMDLPPLNLSSESDDSDEEIATVKSQSMEDGDTKHHSDDEKKDQPNYSPQQQEEEETKPVEIVDGIWDNFKTYAATLGDTKSHLGEVSSEITKEAQTSEDIGLMARIIKAEHDYCFPRENAEETVEHSEEAEAKVKEPDVLKDKDQEDEFDHNYCSNNCKTDGNEIAHSSEAQESSPKKHPKSPKKRKKAGSGSSSSEASESSDSDSSSCSCGTNCSCSSSSSSSASSSSGSDSDSSTASGKGAARTSRREKRKDSKRKRHLGSSSRSEEKACSAGESGIRSPGSLKDGNAKVDAVVAEEETPPLREVMIRESDLETEESETDEDFYDEHPRRYHSNAAAMTLARLAASNSPSTAPLEEATVHSPAMSVQSPASRPASPPPSMQWKLTPPPSSTPVPPAPVVPQSILPVPGLSTPRTPPSVPIVEPEVKNSLDDISEGCTPLIQPKKRGRKRKRPHIPNKLIRKTTENEKYSSDQVPNLYLKVGKTVRRPKIVSPQPSYKNTPPIGVHPIPNSAGTILNSSVMHGAGEPTTPASVIESDDGLRLSKRKRVRKRFYDDSSDENGESGGVGIVSATSTSAGSGKFTIVLNQNAKLQKKKKSSVGSTITYAAEPTGRASIDESSHLIQPSYQSQSMDDQENNMSSDDEESQNGRSERESEGWSAEEGGNEEGPSTVLTSTSPRTASQIPGENVGANTGSLYCYCQCPYDEVSEMIACDGKKCAIEWFHFECVGIMVPPKGKWYCPDCRKRCGSSGRTSDNFSGT